MSVGHGWLAVIIRALGQQHQDRGFDASDVQSAMPCPFPFIP